ncbi:hypothetical protein PHLCEN_2v7946 [Hermanssonia centrifuga]|uniref:Uncharacterized protein n=1 Tax=Hermanssonia centrifuga TaxID=98765 RepID=A0A2R6NV93_9APHY|nr:hypothetical protein PHLCEN_2v7946 [Hermanssonia centrifuga]
MPDNVHTSVPKACNHLSLKATGKRDLQDVEQIAMCRKREKRSRNEHETYLRSFCSQRLGMHQCEVRAGFTPQPIECVEHLRVPGLRARIKTVQEDRELHAE